MQMLKNKQSSFFRLQTFGPRLLLQRDPFPSIVITVEGISTKWSFVEAQEAKVEELMNLLKEKQIGVVGVLTSAQNHWILGVSVMINMELQLRNTGMCIKFIEVPVVILIFSFFWKDKNQNLQVHQGVVRSIMDDVGYKIMKMGNVYEGCGKTFIDDGALRNLHVFQRRIVGLHQITSIRSTYIVDTWTPLEESLLPLGTTRHVSMITITLSTKELNTLSVGSCNAIIGGFIHLTWFEKLSVSFSLNKTSFSPKTSTSLAHKKSV
uniref:Uncharacterized protein n=1 Tax=Lactuca sativa TaxID=4236 RepID=A0A9R1V3F8_LACSA|nr:hypothetical protein LSAT_V11C600313240 [Lactuca sativa]